MSDVIVNDYILPIAPLLSPGFSAFSYSEISKMSHSGITEEEFSFQNDIWHGRVEWMRKAKYR